MALKQYDISQACDRVICSVQLLLGICQVGMLLIDWRTDREKMDLAVTLEGWVNNGGTHNDFWHFGCLTSAFIFLNMVNYSELNSRIIFK